MKWFKKSSRVERLESKVTVLEKRLDKIAKIAEDAKNNSQVFVDYTQKTTVGTLYFYSDKDANYISVKSVISKILDHLKLQLIRPDDSVILQKRKAK